MIAVDTNILVYAFRADSPRHLVAHGCLSSAMSDGRRLAIPWPCVHEFISVVSNPRMPDPASPMEGLSAIRALLGAPRVSVLAEGDEHLELLSALLEGGLVRGPKMHDARTAICLAHGVDELWTVDSDLSPFSALRARNPLVAT